MCDENCRLLLSARCGGCEEEVVVVEKEAVLVDSVLSVSYLKILSAMIGEHATLRVPTTRRCSHRWLPGVYGEASYVTFQNTGNCIGGSSGD